VKIKPRNSNTIETTTVPQKLYQFPTCKPLTNNNPKSFISCPIETSIFGSSNSFAYSPVTSKYVFIYNYIPIVFIYLFIFFSNIKYYIYLNL